jgi:hypothetical protein
MREELRLLIAFSVASGLLVGMFSVLHFCVAKRQV